MTGTLLTVVAGLGFFAWVIAVFAAIQLVRLAPKGEKLKTYGKLGWWQFDEIRKTIGPAADQPIRVYQRAFIAYIIELTGQEPEEARAEIREWLTGELPSDVVMDPRHDNHSIALSKKYVPEGEDEYDDDSRFGDEE